MCIGLVPRVRSKPHTSGTRAKPQAPANQHLSLSLGLLACRQEDILSPGIAATTRDTPHPWATLIYFLTTQRVLNHTWVRLNSLLLEKERPQRGGLLKATTSTSPSSPGKRHAGV